MLKTWGLTNFKSIYNMDKDLEFAPLTVLTGTNSSGKSSFLQSILLIAQTMQNKFYDRSLVLNGDFVDLGQFDEIMALYKQENEKRNFAPISIRWETHFKGNIEKVQFLLDHSDDPVMKARAEEYLDYLENGDFDDENFAYDYFSDLGGIDIHSDFAEYIMDKEYSLQFELKFDSFRCNNDSTENEKRRYRLEQFSPRTIYIKQKIKIKEWEEKEWQEQDGFFSSEIVAEEDENNFYPNILDDTPEEKKYPLLRINPINFFVRLYHFYPARMFFPNPYKDNSSSSEFVEIDRYKYKARFMELEKIFSNFTYLGPLRFHGSLYPFSKAANQKDVGLKGENTAAVLDIFMDKNVSYIPSIYWNKPGPEKSVPLNIPLNEALIDSLKYLGIAEKISIEITKHGYELLSNNVNLSHVGTGVSQVLPILVSCLLAENGSILIYEQPELHLHPRVQSKLADFFISMASIGKQCIIETHSEYFIDKLRLRICQSLLEKNEENKNNTKIYYFSKKGLETTIKEIEINEYADYNVWPDGFFDERQYINEEILNSIDKKMLNTRSDNMETND